MSIKQIDDALINGITPDEPIKKEVEPVESREVSEEETQETKETSGSEIESKPEKAAKENDEKSEPVSSDSEVDDYGLEVPKARMYSEEEVQRMIRDRLSRGQHATPQQQQAIQQAAESFKVDPNSTDSWEVQLKEFVKGTLAEVQKEEKTRSWQREEQERQAAFETKFTTGMEKYSDFREVTKNMPFTDSMMMGVRGMDNLKDPAGFLYAAAKLQPKEVIRISQLPDPFQQAAEMGRLHERMVKARATSKTAIPLKATVSDISQVTKVVAKKNIDSLIQSHAKSKLRKA